MRRIVSLISLLLFTTQISPAQSLKLWYRQPARTWNEALPTGNGRLGVMTFGTVTDEKLQLNESSLWSGGAANPNPAAPTYLPQIRQAVTDQQYESATALTRKMQGLYTESYEPLGMISRRRLVEFMRWCRNLRLSPGADPAQKNRKSLVLRRVSIRW